MRPVLVVNSGSSSLKYQLVGVDNDAALFHGAIERVTDHTAAFEQMLSELAASNVDPVAVGHRVVHGGAKFSKPTLVTDAVIAEIEKLIPLAPLHNPGNLEGIKAAIKAFPGLPQVAIFDTAFHQSMPESSWRYAIDHALADKHGIRKYGFHGTSYEFVAKKTAKFLGTKPTELNAVIMHLGNGASICAVKNGESFDTSMGMTPLPGLVMGTRSGDIDAGLALYLERVAEMDVSQVDHLLNAESGMLGLTGLVDMRDIAEKAGAGDARSAVALEIYAERIRQYLGGYIARLGNVDAIVFTAGVGENSSVVRQMVCANLNVLGIEIDEVKNQDLEQIAREISADTSRVKVLVVPTNEELEIAKQTAALLN